MSDTPSLYHNERAGVTSWLVYINGLEVPCQGVAIACGVWQIPEATITMVPDVSLSRLGAEDRIGTQVFYCDQWYRQPAEFCLMFDGEIVAWSYMMAGNQRALSFSCVDYMSILTQLFFFFMSSFDDIAVGASSEQIGVFGNTVSVAGFGALYPYTLFTQGLADPGDTVANPTLISRPIDFAYNIVRALIKAQHPNRTVPAANFFTPWCRRTNFHRRWVALPYIDADPAGGTRTGIFPILRAVQAEQAIGAIARMASATGTQGSMWDLLREVLMTMMMEVSMIPTPAIVKSDYQSLMPQGAPDVLGAAFLTNYFVKPQFFFGLPPTCNVFFPSQIDNYAYQENYATQPTRMYFNEEAFLSALNRGAQGDGIHTLMQDALTAAYPEECDAALRASVTNPASALNGKNLLVYPEEFFKGPVIDRRSMPRWFSYVLAALSETPKDTTQVPVGTGTGASPNATGQSTVVTTTPANLSGDLQGADDLVLEFRVGQSRAFDQYVKPALQAEGLTLSGNRELLAPRVRGILRALRPETKPIGGWVAPSVFPIEPVTACTAVCGLRRGEDGPGGRFATRGGGSFWAGRTPERIHAGHDIGARKGTRVVATTSGRITVIRSGAGFEGNFIQIVDANGGTHRYMHLDAFAPGLARGPVTAGQLIGFVGGSGGVPVHLHYDITTSGLYRANYTSHLQQLWRGIPSNTTTVPANTPASALPWGGGGAGTIPRAEAPAAAAANAPPSPTSTEAAPAPPPPPPAADTGTGTPNNSGTPEVRSGGAASAVAPGDTARNLFRLYAQHEYYKERYARRTGGLQLAFNPYPVPGFPCATFDRRSSAIDTFGYVMSLRWQMNATSWDTSVSFSHGRTFQEMFALMQRVYATEAARQGLQRGDIEQAVLQQNNASLALFAETVGAIAIAPPEPLQEIRDVIQNFRTADAFYLTVFHQGIGEGRDLQSAATVAEAAERLGTVETTYQTADELALETSPEPGSVSTSARAVVAAARTAAGTAAPGATAKRGVFHYPDIIDFVTPNGVRTGIQIEGIDATARTRLLRVIRAVRARTATPEEMRILADTVGDRVLIPQEGEEFATETAQTLDDLEIELRTQTAATNMRGDVLIVPKPEAQSLFDSYHAAMAYNGRPIVTLDEYVGFLGTNGLREGRVNAGSRGPQKFMAHFYTRIRRPRTGPPLERPNADMANTASATVSGPTGLGEPPPPPSTERTSAAATNEPGVPVTFRQVLELLRADGVTAAEADLLLLWDRNVINASTTSLGALELAILTLSDTAIPAARRAALDTALRQDLFVARTPKAEGEPLPAAVPTDTPAGVPDAVSPPANGETPPVAPAPTAAPTAVRSIDSIPIDFPDTRADWDTALEQYRSNVLTKLPPYT